MSRAVVWVWFGMRSDGRCGRDFGTEQAQLTVCGKGECCSSHGWCGKGEEYCSVALGCQSGCDLVGEDEQRRIDEQAGTGHEKYDDDGAQARHMHGYDDDSGYYPHGGRHGGHPDAYGGHDHDRYDDYHHRYDEDPDQDHHGDEDEHHGGNQDHFDHEDHYGEGMDHDGERLHGGMDDDPEHDES